MGDVVDLGAVTAEPVPEVVDLLERWLERARAGEVRSVGVAASVNDGTVEAAWVLGASYADMHLAAHELTRSVVEGFAR